jgi:hypothetical protein
MQWNVPHSINPPPPELCKAAVLADTLHSLAGDRNDFMKVIAQLDLKFEKMVEKGRRYYCL